MVATDNAGSPRWRCTYWSSTWRSEVSDGADPVVLLRIAERRRTAASARPICSVGDAATPSRNRPDRNPESALKLGVLRSRGLAQTSAISRSLNVTRSRGTLRTSKRCSPEDGSTAKLERVSLSAAISELIRIERPCWMTVADPAACMDRSNRSLIGDWFRFPM